MTLNSSNTLDKYGVSGITIRFQDYQRSMVFHWCVVLSRHATILSVRKEKNPTKWSGFLVVLMYKECSFLSLIQLGHLEIQTARHAVCLSKCVRSTGPLWTTPQVNTTPWAKKRHPRSGIRSVAFECITSWPECWQYCLYVFRPIV